MSGVTDDDLGMDDLIRQVEAMVGPGVYVGIRTDASEELFTIAGANEFGTEDGRVPERSYLRSTMDEGREKYADLLQDGLRKALYGERIQRGLARLGAVAKGDVQRKIRDLKDPPNAKATIKKKKSSNPLIDTGRLRQSIDYAVEG